MKGTDDSVQWRLFDEAVAETRAAFAHVPADELQDTIDEALAKVREKKSRKKVIFRNS